VSVARRSTSTVSSSTARTVLVIGDRRGRDTREGTELAAYVYSARSSRREKAEDIRSVLEQDLKRAREEVEKQKQESEQAYQAVMTLLGSPVKGFELIAKAWNDYEVRCSRAQANSLRQKVRPARKAADEVQAQGRELAEASVMDQGAHKIQHHWRLDGSEMAQIFDGLSPLSDREETLETTDEAPQGAEFPDAPERPGEFSPGLTPELMELVEQAATIGSPNS
jgi:hypothetical protein